MRSRRLFLASAALLLSLPPRAMGQEGRQKLYVLSSNSDDMTVINREFVHVFDVTGDEPRQIARMKTGRTPLWLTITPDGKTVYIANTADDNISAFDVATKTEVARIQLEKGKAPKRMLVVNVPGST